MKFKRENILLIILVIVSLVYAYAYTQGSITLMYFSKPLIAPTALLFYLSKAQKVDKLFILALFFAFLGNVLLIGPDDNFFVLGMSSNLIFILINMLIVTGKITDIDMFKFFKIAIPMILILIAVLYYMFAESRDITLLFYVFGGILALYASFSIYLYNEKKDQASLLNLIGVVLFLLSAIARGFDHINKTKTIYRIINIILYTSSLYFITRAYAEDSKNFSVQSK